MRKYAKKVEKKWSEKERTKSRVGGRKLSEKIDWLDEVEWERMLGTERKSWVESAARK